MRLLFLTLAAALAPTVLSAQEARIDVRADQVLGPVSRYLTGACIEDVNHEIYGGIYSQMIFGESFQEPAPSPSSTQAAEAQEISGMWRAVRRGQATGRYALVTDKPFAAEQSRDQSLPPAQAEIMVGCRHPTPRAKFVSRQ